MLMAACAGPADYRTAQGLLGLQPVHSSRFATFLTRLREHGILDPVMAAICQLARALNDNGAPIDYARRRRLRSLSQAKLDTGGWRRSRYFLTHPDTWAHRRHARRTDLPAAPVQERLARLRLIELSTGTHPSYLPGPLRLPDRYRQDYAEFVLTLPEPIARFLDHRACFLLRHAGIDEPLSWEPPFDWITGITWPGPHPDDITPPTCTRCCARAFPSAPSRPGSPPLPSTSGWPPRATRHPTSRPATRPRPRPAPIRPLPQNSCAPCAGRDSARARSPGSPDAANAPSGAS
jgi:hypothetical protein